VFVIYNCCWTSPVKSFLGPSLVGLMTIFYCLRFETPPDLSARPSYLYPPGTGCPSCNPRHWAPISSPPTTCRAVVEVFERVSTQGSQHSYQLVVCFYSFDTDRYPLTVVCVAVEMNLNKPLHSTGHLRNASLTQQF
jgi:hypothetical protein